MLIVATFLLAFVASIHGKCNEGCNVPVKPYEEMGCEAVFKKPDDCCPEYYNCAKVMGRAADKCFFKNAVYEKGDKIDNQLTSRHCAASCFCEKSEWKDITCANIECPEHLGVRPAPNCILVYEKDSCCSTKTVCAPFDKLAKCEVGGKTYYEGQRFEAPGDAACMSCVCKSGFTGKFEEPFCSTIDCGTELRNAHNVKKHCAPVFYGSSRCCPIQWQCPEETDQFELSGKKSEQQCKFGEKELSVGDKVILKKSSEHSPDIDCECRMPPLVTCIQKPHGN